MDGSVEQEAGRWRCRPTTATAATAATAAATAATIKRLYPGIRQTPSFIGLRWGRTNVLRRYVFISWADYSTLSRLLEKARRLTFLGGRFRVHWVGNTSDVGNGTNALCGVFRFWKCGRRQSMQWPKGRSIFGALKVGCSTLLGEISRECIHRRRWHFHMIPKKYVR